MNSTMMNAKKKALMALIKKMRGLEMEGLGDKEQMTGNMAEGEDSGDAVVNLDPFDSDEKEIGESEDDIDDAGESFADEKRSFMKRHSRLPSKNKTKSMMIAVEMKPKSKLMKKLG